MLLQQLTSLRANAALCRCRVGVRPEQLPRERTVQARQAGGKAGFAALKAVRRNTERFPAAQALHKAEVVGLVGQRKAICRSRSLRHRLRRSSQLHRLDLRVSAQQTIQRDAAGKPLLCAQQVGVNLQIRLHRGQRSIDRDRRVKMGQKSGLDLR